MSARIIVVTGTGTGVGKTIATAALAVRSARRGSVLAVKPAQTGMGPDHDDVADVEVVRHLSGCDAIEHVRLDDPLAPETAAILAGVSIPTVAEHAARILAMAARYDTVLVEGAGGLLVRLDTEGGTLLDLAAQLDADVVVVASAGLGTLNHTELTVGALRARGIEPAGLVIGAWPAAPGLAETCNLSDLPRLTRVPVVAVVPDDAGSLSPADFRRGVDGWWTPEFIE